MSVPHRYLDMAKIEKNSFWDDYWHFIILTQNVFRIVSDVEYFTKDNGTKRVFLILFV